MPFLTGFGKRKEIRYGTVFPGANLTDFPKLFVISGDSDIATELSGGGGIAITLDDGTTTVPFGLYPSSDPTTGDLILRAKFSPLTAASTGDVMGYLYYDSGQTTTEDKAGTVANGYVVFAPLEEDPSGGSPQIYDWVTETNLGVASVVSGSWSSGDRVAGQVGNALNITGGNYIDFGDVSGSLSESSLTVETVYERSGGTNRLWSIGMNGPQLFATDSSLLVVHNSVVDLTGTAVATTVRRAWAVTRSGTTTKIYEGGVLNVSGTVSFTYTIAHLFLGAGNNGSPNEHAYGLYDEFRVSSVARDADWVGYAYADDFTNSDTFSFGAEETPGGGGGTSAGEAFAGVYSPAVVPIRRTQMIAF